MTKTILRIAAMLIGLGAMVLSVIILVDGEETLWRQYVVPLGLIGTGWFFVSYALTGARSLTGFRRRPPT